MPSLDCRLTYCLPVHPDLLGAHLEAYVKLQPTVTALRLCHRFGKGEEVHVTTLPTELVNAVEEYLTESERSVLCEKWTQDFNCWNGRYEIVDHLPTQTCVDMFNGMVYEDSDGDGYFVPHTKLTVMQYLELEEYLQDGEGYAEQCQWLYEHADRRASWRERVGPANGVWTRPVHEA